MNPIVDDHMGQKFPHGDQRQLLDVKRKHAAMKQHGSDIDVHRQFSDTTGRGRLDAGSQNHRQVARKLGHDRSPTGEVFPEARKVEANVPMISENLEVERLVRFTTVVSLGFMTLEIPSRVHRIAAGQSAFAHGLPYSLLSASLGWWALPWGPQRTWEALESNRNGITVPTGMPL